MIAWTLLYFGFLALILQASRLHDSEDRNYRHVSCNNGFQHIRPNLRPVLV